MTISVHSVENKSKKQTELIDNFIDKFGIKK